MHGHSRLALPAAGLLGAGAAGAVFALGGAAAMGAFDGGTTTVREAAVSLPPRSNAPAAAHGGLSVAEIYERAESGVVQVIATTNAEPSTASPFLRSAPAPGESPGSGFVIDKEGHLVTNHSVVAGADEVTVSFTDRDRVRATVVGADRATDLAVLRMDVTSRALTPLPLGDSDALEAGSPVVAIGNPRGLQRTITAGVVSGLSRPLSQPGGARADGVIQTDAALGRGTWGGPLLDADGRVVGVSTTLPSGGAGAPRNAAIGLAIPINTVKDVVADLIAHGRVERPYLGASVRSIEPRLARLFRLPVERGLVVERVEADGPAARAGLRGGTTRVVVAGQSYTLGGDVIVAADGHPVATFAQLHEVLGDHEPGQRIELGVYRGREKEELRIELGQQPPSPG